jgi:hypothetical protein
MIDDDYAVRYFLFQAPELQVQDAGRAQSTTQYFARKT